MPSHINPIKYINISFMYIALSLKLVEVFIYFLLLCHYNELRCMLSTSLFQICYTDFFFFAFLTAFVWVSNISDNKYWK